jgi:hypothetical protein
MKMEWKREEENRKREEGNRISEIELIECILTMFDDTYEPEQYYSEDDIETFLAESFEYEPRN